MSFLNHVIEFCEVIASGLSGPSSAVSMNVSGIAGFRLDENGVPVGEDESDDGGEQAHEQAVYQSLGIIGRPLPRSADGKVEAIGLRSQDGLLPFAFRDLRLHRAVNPGGAGTTPSEGQLLFAGYGGAFLSHALTAENTGEKRGNITTLYCPHDFAADGTPGKAHAITLDPTPGNSSISIAHASGLFVVLTEDAGGGAPGIVASVDGSTFLRMSPGEVSISAEKILLKGNVYLGRAAEAGVQLLGGPLTPTSGSVFVSAL